MRKVTLCSLIKMPSLLQEFRAWVILSRSKLCHKTSRNCVFSALYYFEKGIA
jgi:hypothetical protein